MQSFYTRLQFNSKTAIYTQIIFVLVMLWFRDVAHFPSFITYFTDVLSVLILFSCCYRRTKFYIFKDALSQYMIFVVIVFCMLIGAIINFVEPILVLWGMRNNLRFFLFFFICISLLDVTDVDKLLAFFKKFFWANLVMCTIQYFGFGFKADYLGGFFGTTRGCNGYLNVFLCMVCATVLADYFVVKAKAGRLVLYLMAALYVAIIAELKVFYVEIVLMVGIAIIMNKRTFKAVMATVLFGATFALGLFLLLMYDPSSFNVWFDADVLELYLAGNGYTNSGDLNRFTAINQIYEKFFEGNFLLTLFGFGLGNCEYSQFSFLQSDFSQMYGDLNYRWFTHAWVFLEQGCIGLVLLVVFLVAIVIYACRYVKTSNSYYMILTASFLPTCILGLMYNSAIQVESAYLFAFMCAIPYVVNKKNMRINHE